MVTPTRRTVLSTALAGAATLPTAGCAAPTASSGGSSDERSSEDPSSGDSAKDSSGDLSTLARSWVPDPATLQPAAHAKLFALDWRAVVGVRGELADGTYRKYRNYVRFLDVARLGVRPGDVSELVQVYPPASSPRRAAVVRAGFDGDRLRERLAAGYDRRARHRGFDLFWSDGSGARADGTDASPVEWGGRTVAAATGGRHLVLGAPTPTRSARAVVERVADARAGVAPGYVEANASLRAVLDALGGGDDASAATYARVPAADAAPGHARFAGAVATGHRYRFRGGTTRSRYAFAFADPAAADPAAVGRWVGAHRDGRLLGDYRSVSVARRGRTVVVDGTLPTAAV